MKHESCEIQQFSTNSDRVTNKSYTKIRLNPYRIFSGVIKGITYHVLFSVGLFISIFFFSRRDDQNCCRDFLPDVEQDVFLVFPSQRRFTAPFYHPFRQKWPITESVVLLSHRFHNLFRLAFQITTGIRWQSETDVNRFPLLTIDSSKRL